MSHIEEKQGYKQTKYGELPYLLSPNVGYTPECNEILWRAILGEKLNCNRCGILCTNR
jgi:hypothetical protein